MSPIMDQNTLDFISHGAAQTRRLGMRLGRLFVGGEVVCLIGTLGTGKTCLAQGIGRGLGIHEMITSPTFTLINEYRARLVFYHIDLYRIVDVGDTLAFGLDEYLYGDGVCVIEWAERVEQIWPQEYLQIHLRHTDETKRGLTFRGFGARYVDLLRTFRRETFGI